MIIIEGNPINKSAEAKPLLKVADKVLLAVRKRRTPIKNLKIGDLMFLQNPHKTIGWIITHCNRINNLQWSVDAQLKQKTEEGKIITLNSPYKNNAEAS